MLVGQIARRPVAAVSVERVFKWRRSSRRRVSGKSAGGKSFVQLPVAPGRHRSRVGAAPASDGAGNSFVHFSRSVAGRISPARLALRCSRKARCARWVAMPAALA